MSKQEVMITVILSVVLLTPIIFTAYNLYKIDQWFQRVEQRLDTAEKKTDSKLSQ
jgi:hypothetical protein